MELNVIASPLQGCRNVFDLMPTATRRTGRPSPPGSPRCPPPWSSGPSRCASPPTAGWSRPADRSTECIAQCERLTSADGFFATFAARASADGAPLDDAVRADLERGVEAAAGAYRRIGDDLRTQLLDRAPESDAAGRERYRLASRQFLGASVDLEETYAWGQEELARITADMVVTAGRVVPGASVKEAIEHLDHDPRYMLHGTDALRDWMQARADEVIADMADTHFDIPGPVRTIEGRIAPTQTGGIYYTGPATTSPARAGCGGRCPGASPSSAPGAS